MWIISFRTPAMCTAVKQDVHAPKRTQMRRTLMKGQLVSVNVTFCLYTNDKYLRTYIVDFYLFKMPKC